MVEAVRRSVRWWWVLAAAVAVLVAALVVLSSWSGQCTDYAIDTGAVSQCTSGPTLSVLGVFVLLGDALFFICALRRVRPRVR
jgi:hypothetical protein